MKASSSAAAIVLTCLGAMAHAGIIASERVQYTAGPLAGDMPAHGFASFWIGDAGVQVSPAELNSSLDLPSSGGAGTGFNSTAPLAAALLPSTNPDFSASVLIAHAGPNNQTYMGLSQSVTPLGNPPLVAFDVQLGQYGIFVGGAIPPSAVAFTPAGATDFLIATLTTTIRVEALNADAATCFLQQFVAGCP
jgi:hypothetical protein